MQSFEAGSDIQTPKVIDFDAEVTSKNLSVFLANVDAAIAEGKKAGLDFETDFTKKISDNTLIPVLQELAFYVKVHPHQKDYNQKIVDLIHKNFQPKESFNSKEIQDLVAGGRKVIIQTQLGDRKLVLNYLKVICGMPDSVANKITIQCKDDLVVTSPEERNIAAAVSVAKVTPEALPDSKKPSTLTRNIVAGLGVLALMSGLGTLASATDLTLTRHPSSLLESSLFGGGAAALIIAAVLLVAFRKGSAPVETSEENHVHASAHH